MERSYKVGQHVIYVDPAGEAHDALVTAWWERGYPTVYVDGERAPAHNERGCNLVYVSSDDSKTDPYGRQLEARATSVVHKSGQPAPGNFWRWPDEVK